MRSVRGVNENQLPQAGVCVGMDDLQTPPSRTELVWTLLAIAAVSLLARLVLPLVS